MEKEKGKRKESPTTRSASVAAREGVVAGVDQLVRVVVAGRAARRNLEHERRAEQHFLRQVIARDLGEWKKEGTEI